MGLIDPVAAHAVLSELKELQLRSRLLADRIYDLGDRRGSHQFSRLRRLDDATAHMHDAARIVEALLAEWEPQHREA